MSGKVLLYGAWRPIDEALDLLRLLNHPGHPDQSSHGRKRGRASGTDLIGDGDGAALARGVLRSAANRETEPGSGVGANGDEMLHAITAKQGFNGRPAVASRQELDALIEAGHRPLFRGVQSTATKTDAEMAEQIRTGEAYQGFGVWGNGTYTSNQILVARRYGVPVRMALHPQARVISQADLKAEHQAFMARQPPGSPSHRVFSDPGRYAAARGYDAVDVKGSLEDEVLVLNRSALTVAV